MTYKLQILSEKAKYLLFFCMHGQIFHQRAAKKTKTKHLLQRKEEKEFIE